MFGGEFVLILNLWVHTTFNMWIVLRIHFPWSSTFGYFNHKLLHIFVSCRENMDTKPYNFFSTIPKSDSFYSTYGTRVFLKYWLVSLSILSELGAKCLQYAVFRKRVHGCILLLYLFDYLSDRTHLNKVETFISKTLKVFDLKCFCTIQSFSF